MNVPRENLLRLPAGTLVEITGRRISSAGQKTLRATVSGPGSTESTLCLKLSDGREIGLLVLGLALTQLYYVPSGRLIMQNLSVSTVQS